MQLLYLINNIYMYLCMYDWTYNNKYNKSQKLHSLNKCKKICKPQDTKKKRKQLNKKIMYNKEQQLRVFIRYIKLYLAVYNSHQ